MEELLKKLKGKDFDEQIIKDNIKFFDMIIEHLKPEIDKNFFISQGYNEEEIIKLIDNMRKSDTYYWFFSVEKIRNHEIDEGQLLVLLNKDVLYQSLESDDGAGLRNMVMNFVSMNLIPDDVIKVCSELFGIDDKYSKIIADFYRNTYPTLQMNYIIGCLRQNKNA